MTVQYNLDVSTSRPWTLFKLLFRWRGSIWKSVILELFVWMVLFAAISMIYRVALTNEQISKFEQFIRYCDEKLDYIPLNFMLGFFVTIVLSRWVNFFVNIGYIDNIALMIAAYVKGSDDRARMLRRNIIRYCVLSQALVFRDISMRVRKRFPTIEALVAAGFMMKHEKEKYDAIQYRYAKYWMPFQWALSLCQEARNQQKISSDVLLEKVGEEIKRFRTNLAILCNFDWVPLPIMYPQLIVLAVHTYFLVGAFARQYITSEKAQNDLLSIHEYLPLMTIIQFVFYMGWLKVAEAMLNPFGEDDDDFECNFLLDKNLTVGLTIVDAGCGKTPALLKDIFWSEAQIEPLYSAESARGEYRLSGLTGSTANVRLTDQNGKIKMLPLSRGIENHYSITGFLRNSMRHSLRGGKTDHHGGIMNIVRHKFGRSLSHSHFNTIQNDDYGYKTGQSVDELSGLEKGYTKWAVNNESRRSSLNRVLETIINESYDNPNVNLSDEDLPLTLKHISPTTTGDGRYVGHLGLSQTSMLCKLEDLMEESEEALSRKNTNIENILANHVTVNNLNLRNNGGKISMNDVDRSMLTRQRSVSSEDVNRSAKIAIRRQNSFPEDNSGNKSSFM